MFFVKNENGVWDNYNCYECCSDCNHPHEHCRCPLNFEQTCKNCIFDNGYKKCEKCHTNSRTNNADYIEEGYWHLCDTCIDNIKSVD